MFQVKSWPNVILHIDADAFFASVYQAIHPQSQNKPVVVGKERGIATAVSYQAKKLGIKRGMAIAYIKKIFPSVLIVESDYEIYELFSQRIFEIIKKFSPLVERYSIDEFFVDLKGLRRYLNKSYQEIAIAIKKEIENKLGITVSLGLSINKSLSKLASSFNKPSGFTVVDGLSIERFLKKIPINKVWGIGENTSSFLNKLGILTAYDFAVKSEDFIKKYLTKPFFEIWQELRGGIIFNLNLDKKENYKSITRSGSFPLTNNRNFLFSRLIFHLNEAFLTARKFEYLIGGVEIFLKNSYFCFFKEKIIFNPPIKYPLLINNSVKEKFELIYNKNFLYRSCGCVIFDFKEEKFTQPSLFNNNQKEEKLEKIYQLIDKQKIDFGTILYDKKRKREVFICKKKIKIPFIFLQEN